MKTDSFNLKSESDTSIICNQMNSYRSLLQGNYFENP